MPTRDTLTINAFWAAEKSFPSEQAPTSRTGKIFHEYYSGKEPHLGWMDLVQLRTLIKENHIKHIILKNLDILGKIGYITKEIKVCISYVYDYQVLSYIPQKVNLKKCKPSFRTIVFGGWDLSDTDDEIPSRAEHYMRSLLVYTKVESITYSNSKVKVTAYWQSSNTPVVISEKI